MLEKYIKQLLFDHDCVVIPGFGGFVVNYESATIQSSKNSILPPTKQIAFNEKINDDDGLLKKAIKHNENISDRKAEEKISDFVKYIKENIYKFKHFSINNIGKFYINDYNHIDFEPFDKLNFRADSYGLPELFFKPLIFESNNNSIFNLKEKKTMAEYDERNDYEYDDSDEEFEDEYEGEEEEEEEEDQGSNGIPNALIYSLIGLVLLVTIFTSYYIFLGHKDNAFNRALANVFPFMGPGEKKEVKEEKKENKLLPDSKEEDNSNNKSDTSDSFEKNKSLSEDDFSSESGKKDKKKKEGKEVKNKANQNSSSGKIVNSRTGRWYIMVGAFSVKQNAYDLNKKLRNKGLKSKIIKPYDGNGLHKVTLEDHGELEKCLDRAEKLRPEYGKEIWCMHY